MTSHPYSKHEKEITLYLYKFRYSKINQLQKLFNHKYPSRIKIWLKNLLNNHYIEVLKDNKNQTKPYIFCLDQKAHEIFMEDKEVDNNFIKRLYKEKTYSQKFIGKNLFIADCYLFFLEHKNETSVINFFTRQDLFGFDYFPKPFPDAYIDEETGKQNNRYFLEVFSYDVPLKYHLKRVAYYFDYYDNGSWGESTGNVPFPTLLIICTNEYMKKKVHYYIRSLLERSFDNLAIFLTTRTKIYSDDKNQNIWDEVKVEV